MNLPEITTPAAAFIGGLVTSVHCMGMCGPLACTFCGKRSGSGAFTLGLYHATRILSYTLLGVVVGMFGQSVAWILQGATTKILPWALVLFFMALALGLDKRLNVGSLVGRVFPAVTAKLRHASGAKLGAMLGLATPFLPCGPLYLVVAVVIFSGSAVAGGTMMAAFGLGTVPLLLVAQLQFFRLQRVLSPQKLAYIQRGVALLSACLIVWRVTVGAEFDFINPQDMSCCH